MESSRQEQVPGRPANFLSRSQLVKRGFQRLALAGFIAFAIAVGVGGFLWWNDSRAPLIVKTTSGFQTIVDEPSPAVGYQLQKLYGAPSYSYSDLTLVHAGEHESYPYQWAIESARLDKAQSVAEARQLAEMSAFLAILWAGGLLLVSWLLRGFMN